MWVKLYKKKYPLPNELFHVLKSVATLGVGKYNDRAGLLLHKRKDGNTQWLYHYTIHGRRRKTGLGILRDVSLKQKVLQIVLFTYLF